CARHAGTFHWYFDVW
nr:immunoglobulin heavy chain junction region [Mus musculus]